MEHLAANTLALNEIGVCNLSLDRPIPFDPYVENRDTGGFVIIDKITQNTVGAGLLHFALRRSHNIHWQEVRVDKAARIALGAHRPGVVWFTGLSGSGKSTIANIVESKLHTSGVRTYLLDGDNVRHGLNRDLGFTDADRVENIRRIAEVARLMVDAGLVVLVSFISPFRAERQLARERVEQDEFVEVFVDTPLAVAEAARPEGSLRQGARRSAPQLHRHRVAVRTTRASRGARRHHGDDPGGGRRHGDRGAPLPRHRAVAPRGRCRSGVERAVHHGRADDLPHIATTHDRAAHRQVDDGGVREAVGALELIVRPALAARG